MKKGKARIIAGVILIILQIMSLAGNAKAGVVIQLSSLYDITYLIGYFLVGIIGVVLLISGIVSYLKNK